MSSNLIVIDDKLFLLGFISLVRSFQKRYEVTTLLPAAESCIKDLGLEIKKYPVEGYYSESEPLSKYFLLVKNLQNESLNREKDISDKNSLSLLLSYTNSGLFGSVEREQLLPVARNVVNYTLKELPIEDWNIGKILNTAYDKAISKDDISLVGIAALSKDAVVVCYASETVVLYTAKELGTALRAPKTEYVWQVSPEIEKRAKSFVEVFKKLTGADFADVSPSNAAFFYHAINKKDIYNRCVNLGYDLKNNFYHWAIDVDENQNLSVKDFWDTKIWTTDEYKASKITK